MARERRPTGSGSAVLRIQSQRQQRYATALRPRSQSNIPVGRGLLVGNNMNPVLDKVIGGWSASSNLTLQSGQPVHIEMALDRLANGTQRPNVTCSNPGAGISPHAAAAALLNGASSGISVFNANCFADPGDQQLGNAPRYFSNLTSQGIENVDLGLQETVHHSRDQEVADSDGGF